MAHICAWRRAAFLQPPDYRPQKISAKHLHIFWFVISTCLLVASCIPLALLAADGGSTAGDPFEAYQRAVENQLSAILARDQVQPHEVHESAPIDQNIAANGSKEVEIRTFAGRFWGGREAEFVAALDRFERLRPTLEPILESEGVPKQLVAVVLIESGAEPLAISPRQARGLWQFIPETARQYGLTVSAGKDERIYVEAATRAAARYLRDLHSHFGEWPLVLAAYNAGETAVEGALEKGGVSTFWQLSTAGLLPQETRSYVPAVFAAIELLDSTQPAIPIDGKAQHTDWVYASQ